MQFYQKIYYLENHNFLYQKCNTSNVCQTSKIESTLNNEIKLEILKKAAFLVKEDGLKYKEKHGEHKSAFYK